MYPGFFSIRCKTNVKIGWKEKLNVEQLGPWCKLWDVDMNGKKTKYTFITRGIRFVVCNDYWKVICINFGHICLFWIKPSETQLHVVIQLRDIHGQGEPILDLTFPVVCFQTYGIGMLAKTDSKNCRNGPTSSAGQKNSKYNLSLCCLFVLLPLCCDFQLVSGPKVIKPFSSSTQLSMKFKRPISTEITKIDWNFRLRLPNPILYHAYKCFKWQQLLAF